MSDENKKNRVNLGNSGNNNFKQSVPQDDYDFEEPQRSTIGKIFFTIMLLTIIGLLGLSYTIYKDKELFKKELVIEKNKLAKIEHDENKKLYGNLHIEVEDPEKGMLEEKKTGPAGVDIYVNGQLKSKTRSVTITNQDISQDLIFEFKKPGYFPVRLEVKSCNWRKAGKDQFAYENREIRLARDEEAMKKLEDEKKAKEKEAKDRKNNKKKRKR